MTRITRLLTADVDTADELMQEMFPELIDDFGANVPDALQGNRLRVISYLQAFRALIDSLLGELARERPDLVRIADDGYSILDEKGEPSPLAGRLLFRAAVDIPFCRWVSSFDVGRGTALGTLAKLRELLGGVQPLTSRQGPPGLPRDEGTDFERFESEVTMLLRKSREIEELEAMSEIERVARIFQLKNTELGKMFGVSRQAVTQWMKQGVPSSRLSKVSVVADIGALLVRKLKPGRVPTAARRRADTYGGLSMLEMIERDCHEELLENLNELFDWSATA